MAEDEERLKAAARNSGGEEGRAEGQVRLLNARGSAELREVASGPATYGLWLSDRKVGSQIISKNRSRLPGRGTIKEVRGGRRRASDRTKERGYRFRVSFGRERRASRLPCLSFGLGDDI